MQRTRRRHRATGNYSATKGKACIS